MFKYLQEIKWSEIEEWATEKKPKRNIKNKGFLYIPGPFGLKLLYILHFYNWEIFMLFLNSLFHSVTKLLENRNHFFSSPYYKCMPHNAIWFVCLAKWHCQRVALAGGRDMIVMITSLSSIHSQANSTNLSKNVHDIQMHLQENSPSFSLRTKC